MKKLLPITLIMCLLLSIFSIGASAESDFTQADAEKLFKEAYLRLYVIYDMPLETEEIISFDYFVSNHVDCFFGDDSNYFEVTIAFEKSPNGIRYESADSIGKGDGDYYIVVDERFNTLEKCYAYAKEIFTDDIATSLIDNNATNIDKNAPKPSFRKLGTDYKLFAYGIEESKIPLTADTIVQSRGYGTIMHRSVSSIGKVTVSQNTAVLPIVFCHTIYKEGIGFRLVNIAMTVNFSNTENGWRVSGGSLFDYYMNKTTIEKLIDENPDIIIKNPSTSDKAPLYIAAIALVSLAAPVVMNRRRREF